MDDALAQTVPLLPRTFDFREHDARSSRRFLRPCAAAALHGSVRAAGGGAIAAVRPADARPCAAMVTDFPTPRHNRRAPLAEV